MNAQEIEAILARSTRTGWSELRRMVWFYLVIMAAGVLVVGWDCVTYRSNPVWMAVLGGFMVLLAGFTAYGFNVLREMQGLEESLEGLAGLVKRQLRFFRTRYQVWMAMVAMAIWLVGFAVSLQMYHENGRYGVAVDWFLIVFTAIQAAIIYAMVRMAHHLFSRRLLAALEDLDDQATDRTERIERGRKRLKTLLVLAAIIGAILFISLLVQLASR